MGENWLKFKSVAEELKDEIKPLPRDRLELLELEALVDFINANHAKNGVQAAYSMFYLQHSQDVHSIIIEGPKDKDRMEQKVWILISGDKLQVCYSGMSIPDKELSKDNTDWAHVFKTLQTALFYGLPADDQIRFTEASLDQVIEIADNYLPPRFDNS